jgi:hypothetical protein
MKSKLLLLTGIVALAFVGPINARAAAIIIADFHEAADPVGEMTDPSVVTIEDFTTTSVAIQQIFEDEPHSQDGVT